MVNLAKLLAFSACVAAGCEADVPPPDAPGAPTVEYLTPTEHLVRASMTLRGVRPSIEDLARVAADPDALPAIVDTYLASPAFGAMVRDLHAETLLVRVDGAPFRSFHELDGRTVAEVQTVFEEPLRLIEYVVTHDRPYTEIVTADYAISDPISAVVWGMTRDGSASELQVSHWIDARPVAGILSSSGLFARHISAGANYNRGRANLVSSALLCFDFLHSNIDLDTSIDLANPQVVSNAVRTNPSCAGCHQALDPLASTLFGFQPGARYVSYPVPMWGPQYAGWMGKNDRPPGYFGVPAPTIADVGRLMAEDPRFPRCAATRFAAYMTETDREAQPFGWISELTEGFVASGYSAKQLAREIVLSDRFRVSHVTADATPDEAETTNGMLHVRPEQLDTMFFDLTGVRWQSSDTGTVYEGATVNNNQPIPYGQANLLRSDHSGFRTLAGGIDSYFVTRPVHTTNAVSSLTLRVLATTAAGFVVDDDFSLPAAERHLLAGVEPTDTSEPVVRAQLAKLHARIYGALDPADGTEVGATYTLFASVLARTGDVRHAWKTTLAAMLSDLRVAHF
ncbi:MAG: hypothetical protein IPQ07_43435 [Myxococcales bacterium]|nr:hypothetical protein [Myxococcales bacterium]